MSLKGLASTNIGGSEVTAAAVIAANAVVIGDDGARGIKGSAASVDSSGVLLSNAITVQTATATPPTNGYGMFLFTGNQLALSVNGSLVAVWTSSAANPLNYNANAERSCQLINVNAGANAIVGQVWRNSTLGAGADYAWIKLNGGGNSAGTNGANALNIENTGDLWLRQNGTNFFGIASGAITGSAIAPTQAASSVAGNTVSISASAATAGSSNAGAAAGGAISITAGNAARFTSGNSAGGAIGLTGGTSIGAAAGGAINITGGTSDVIANSSGGAVVITGGAGTGTANTIAGGAITATSGVGAASNSSGGTAGASGVHTMATAAGGAATNNGGGTGGASGAISITSGAGGAASGNGGTKTGGASGAIAITTSAGGNAAAGGTPTGGNSGSITLSTGIAGTGSTANGTVGTIILQTGGVTGLTISTAQAVVVASGKVLQLGNAATTGLAAGVLAALTNATIVITDSGGQAYRIPCII